MVTLLTPEHPEEPGNDDNRRSASLSKHLANANNERKKEYVKKQKQTRDHTCHWPVCNRQVPPAMWGCRVHWMRLPKYLRDKVWDAYEPGQEVDGMPSTTYLAAVREVRRWIKVNYKTEEDS